MNGSLEIQRNYNHYDSSLLSLSYFLYYLKHCIYKVFGEHIIFLTTIILSLLLLYSQRESVKFKKLFNVVFFTIIAGTVFFISLYLLNDSCDHFGISKGNIPTWWFLYFSFNVQWELILFTIIIFLFGQISLIKEKKVLFIMLSIFLSGSIISTLVSHQSQINKPLYEKETRQKLYIMDKMALSALKNEFPMILPASYMPSFYTIHKNNEVMPYDLVDGTYEGKVYFSNEIDDNKLPYLQYLEAVYDIEVKKGMMFTTEEDVKEIAEMQLKSWRKMKEKLVKRTYKILILLN